MAIHHIVPASTHQSADRTNGEDIRSLFSIPQFNLSLFEAHRSPCLNPSTPSPRGLAGTIVAYSLDTQYIAELHAGAKNPELYDNLLSMSVGSYLGFVSFVCKYEPRLRTQPIEYVINFVGRKTSILGDIYSPVAPLSVPVASLIDTTPTANKDINDLAVWTTTSGKLHIHLGDLIGLTQVHQVP